MKEEALLITINNTNYNYGNRLQNYAIVHILSKMNIPCKTLCFEREKGRRIKLEIKRLCHLFSLYLLTSNKVYWTKTVKKELAFLKFDKKYIDMHYEENLDNLRDKYRFYLVGSDQVWNPLWYNNVRKRAYLLDFVKKGKKISVSPSFGLDSLPDEWEAYFKEELTKIPFLSVREEQGAKIIRQLTGRSATVLIDPTMLLDAEEWRKLEHKPIGCEEKPYILTYFLSTKCDAAEKIIKELSKDRNVYELLEEQDSVTSTAGPEEFLYLFSHADLILTDSFHACIFSFLYNKPFLVFDRCESINMNSRLVTLLQKFDLERKYYLSKMENDIWEHDYTEGYKRLEIERKKVFEYFMKAFEK